MLEGGGFLLRQDGIYADGLWSYYQWRTGCEGVHVLGLPRQEFFLPWRRSLLNIGSGAAECKSVRSMSDNKQGVGVMRRANNGAEPTV